MYEIKKIILELEPVIENANKMVLDGREITIKDWYTIRDAYFKLKELTNV